MKILSIGNSFSQDAQKWLHDICKTAGHDVTCINLYIGGCSLEHHWERYLDDEPEYRYELNGVDKKAITLKEALSADKYDIITLQQVSHLSAYKETYVPYLENLYNVVKEAQPDAKIYIHHTWAYQDGHKSDFDNDSEKMYKRVTDGYKFAAELIGCSLIKVGPFIQYLRRNLPEFDSKTGINITRDGYHLSLTYGRFAAGLIWFATLVGGDIDKVDLIPLEIDGVPADKQIIEKIKSAAKEFLKTV
ncbi:MAG: DUF4886 domain-containing protein [Ruminococcaceae bacterium]|nr:DUF4886 domain-containing protein [Oscillospiraceae bacterium]